MGGHKHNHEMAGRKLSIAIGLTVVILLVELVGGFLSNSLALLSDAGHVLTDLAALGLAWFATVQAQRPADYRKTYGYHRTGILAALANAITLILIVIVIGYEAVMRFQHPQTVTPLAIFVAAGVGILVNLYIGLGLREVGSHNINVRAATLHVFSDVAASAGVILGGLIIVATGWYSVDPIISLFIAALIALGAWNILRETVDILMESSPKGLNIAQMVRDVTREPGVEDVHDLHVWSVAGGMHALSAHIKVGDRPLSECDRLVDRINHLLKEKYAIDHTTIQIECSGCELDHLYCAIRPSVENQPHTHGRGGRREAHT